MTPNPTPSVQEAREQVVAIVRDAACAKRGNPPRHPSLERKYQRDIAGGIADIDALIAAVRRERDAEIRGMVEGMKSSCGSGGRDVGDPPCCISVSDFLDLLDRKGAT